MKHIALRLALSLVLLAAQPLSAQTLPTPPGEEDEGLSLMQEGARQLFRGLMREMEPALDDMGRALSDMEPALQNLLALIDDIRNYDAPRVLDNGDILIPRRKDAPRANPPEPLPPPQGEVEL